MMKRVKVLVQVILQVWEDDSYELELNENSVSSEISIIEDDAYNKFVSDDYELLEDVQDINMEG